MATAKQKAWRAKFARLYGGKKKKRSSTSPKKKRSSTNRRRRVRPMARRRYARKRRGGRRKGGISISLLTLAQYTVLYNILTGHDLGSLITQLINSIMTNDDSLMDIIIGEVNAALGNITGNPVAIALKGAIVVMVFQALKKAVGSRKLIGVGKFSIRV